MIELTLTHITDVCYCPTCGTSYADGFSLVCNEVKGFNVELTPMAACCDSDYYDICHLLEKLIIQNRNKGFPKVDAIESYSVWELPEIYAPECFTTCVVEGESYTSQSTDDDAVLKHFIMNLFDLEVNITSDYITYDDNDDWDDWGEDDGWGDENEDEEDEEDEED